MKVGDLVVYSKDPLKYWEKQRTIKSIWEIEDIEDSIYVTLVSNHSNRSFVTSVNNVIPLSKVIKNNMLNKDYIVRISLDTFKAKYTILDRFKGFYAKNKKHNSNYEIAIDKQSKLDHQLDAHIYNSYVANDKKLKNKLKDKTMQIVEDNADAAKIAAKITVGKTLNSTLIKQVKPQLPMLMRGYTDSVLADVVIANIANFAVQNFFSDNDKAVYAADAMMQAAMVEFMSKVNIEEILSSLLSGVTIPESEGEKVADV